MTTSHDSQDPSTTGAASGLSQTPESGGNGGNGGNGGARPICPGEGDRFTIGPGVERASLMRPYERQPGDPLYRPLRIYTLDPGASRLDGATAVVNVPYEKITDGLTGSLFQVQSARKDARIVNLNDPRVLIANGRTPSTHDPEFHQQMVYAVCMLTYAAFRMALGRHVAWGFEPRKGEPPRPLRLRIIPDLETLEDGQYDPSNGQLLFGVKDVPENVAGGRLAPNSRFHICVSHDIVVHETTHALLAGLRAHFGDFTLPQVRGFHEGFADLVALLQHFSYREVVRAALRNSRGLVSQAHLLTVLSMQFGLIKGEEKGLRTAVDLGPMGEVVPRRFEPGLPIQDIGEVLVSAVFDAFVTVYTRKTERYVRLATGGTGVLPPGELPDDLQAVLAEEASQLASQFLNVCIRAIDYCPPVNLKLGDFLRAVITADLELVPHDPWAYREAWIDAFARHRIFPDGAPSLAEEDVRWPAASDGLERVKALSFSRLRFNGDPARPAGRKELRRQACVLGGVVARNLEDFGLAEPRNGVVDLPQVESIRSARRVGPDGQVVFDLVAEVTQRHLVRGENGRTFALHGGATIILGPSGEIRYVISKPIDAPAVEEQKSFITSEEGKAYWEEGPEGYPVPNPRAPHSRRELRFLDSLREAQP